MQVNISAAAYPEKSILRNLLQYYLYEFSLSPEIEPDDKGQFQYPYLDRYWIEPERFPYLVRVNGGGSRICSLEERYLFSGDFGK
jgi:hypothetical protein